LKASAASLKPAAEPLLASGKALAYSGELLITVTNNIGLYGGALSATGANIRNAGDCVAQAAASCRFKTGMELVIDELREASTCLLEGRDKLVLAVDEAMIDSKKRNDKKAKNGQMSGDEIEIESLHMAGILKASVKPMTDCGTALEYAGKGIMVGHPVDQIGLSFSTAGEALLSLSELILELREKNAEKDIELCSQRMKFAGEQMVLAGRKLQGIKEDKPKGKSWLKAGL
jgi:hypothetical protein